MGVTQSQELSNTIAASVSQGRGLEYLLEDPNFILHYKASCAVLPIKARRRLLTQNQSRDNRGKNYLLKIRQVREVDICISEGLKPFYELWKQPKRFFNQSLRLQGVSAVSEVYTELRQIERHFDDPIRQRLYAVALFDLRNLVDEKISLKLKPEAKQKIVQVISDSTAVKDSLEDVAKWTELYLKFGERMKEIAIRNGGLGALILMPPRLLTLRQWAKEMNAEEFDLGVQHLQTIGLWRQAQEAEAHAVAERIHRHILQEFTSGLERSNKDYEQQTTNEADEESMDDDVLQDSGPSEIGNITSSCTSLSDGFQGSHEDREHLGQIAEAGNPTMTDDQQHPHHLTSKVHSEHPIAPTVVSSMEMLSQAAKVVFRQSGQRDESRDSVPTVQDLQNMPSDPFSSRTAVETEQRHGFERNEIDFRQDEYPVANGYGLDNRMPNAPEPRTSLERSQATTVPLFSDSTYNQSANTSFMSGANDIVDPRSHADIPNNQYFSQAFELHDPYFPQAIDYEESLFAG